MLMHDWNSECQDAVLLIHPMIASADGMRELIANRLGDGYRYLAPDLSGHGEAASATYGSATEEAAGIHAYLTSHGVTHLRLGYGASLGGVVLLQLLKYDGLHFDQLFFEGTSFYTHARLMYVVLRTVFLKKHRKAVADPENSVKKMAGMFGEEAAPALIRRFAAMDERSIRNIVHDCGFVELPPMSEDVQRRCTFAYGDKDFDYKKAMAELPKVYPCARTMVWKGYGHCGRLTADPEGYVATLRDILEG